MSDIRTKSQGRSAVAGAESTIREIAQQPAIWREAAAKIADGREVIDAFLAPLLAQSNLRIVLTGAGTSAFAGGVAAPALSRSLKRRIDSIATTDIVSNPRDYFAEDVPTLLVSFARSGNSPESVAATRLADAVLTDVHHLVITCDPTGDLSEEHTGRPNSLVVHMPSGANDAGFAMTSSFTSMLLSALLIFTNEQSDLVDALAAAAAYLIDERWDSIENLALEDTRRVVFLGSGPLSSLAQESALKLLELTAGGVVSFHDSALGFRHGPKAVLDDRTIAVVYVSSDEYTARYDIDIVTELRATLGADKVLAVTTQDPGSVQSLLLPGLVGVDDSYLAIAYVVAAQILALSFALRAGTTPDNPFPGGSVNRVVRGVRIHDLPTRNTPPGHQA